MLTSCDTVSLISTENGSETARQFEELRGRCLQTLSRILDAKDPATRLTAYPAAKLASAIGKAIGIDAETLRRIELGVMLRDIGTIGIPDSILKKCGRLSSAELTKVQGHPALGVSILNPLLGTENTVLAVVMHHHERWDGTGYPARLREHDIPFEARLVAAADAFVAMVSERPYRKALQPNIAMRMLDVGAGGQWDPDVVHALLRLPFGMASNIVRSVSPN